MSAFTESVVEDTALAWLETLGWRIRHGPGIAAGESGAECGRPNYRDVVLDGRLRQALTRLNSALPAERLEDAFHKLTRLDAPTLLERNRAARRILVNGVTVEYRRTDGSIVGDQARVIDFDAPGNDDWAAVNQFTVSEGKRARRPDVVLGVTDAKAGGGRMMAEAPGGEVIVYEAPDGEVRVDVRLERETVWLTQAQMAELFGRERSVVTRHVRNAFLEGELDPAGTSAKFAQVRTEGGRTVTREVEHFNLDVIISVGYRVKSLRGTQFRIWATRTLREHLVRGFTLDRQRFAHNAAELEAALSLVRKAAAGEALTTDQGRGLVDVIARYTQTFLLLQRYDEGLLADPKGTRGGELLAVDEARAAVERLKADLIARREATNLFGREREGGLAALLGNLDQSVFGEPAYPTVEAKAVHLLYFVIKKHPFSDGNKRIGSFLFVDFLNRNGRLFQGGEAVINDVGLAALALLVAERGDPNYHDVVLEGRLRRALARLNPALPAEGLEDAVRKLTRLDAPTLMERNRAAHRMLVSGVTVEYRRADGSIAGDQASAQPRQARAVVLQMKDYLKALGDARAYPVLIVERPADEGILADRDEAAPGIWCTGLAQTYLDLCASGERGVEAAEHLRLTRIAPLWKAVA